MKERKKERKRTKENERERKRKKEELKQEKNTKDFFLARKRFSLFSITIIVTTTKEFIQGK